MQKSIFYIVFGLLSIILLNSCNPEPTVPDQDKIYTVYRLNYNDSEHKTTAEVSFYLNEVASNSQEKLEVKHPSEVLYNEEQLIFDNTSRTYSKAFISLIEGSFRYKNFDGTTYINQVSMIDSVALLIASDSANLQSDYYFEVIGPPLATGEELEVNVESLNSGVKFQSTFSNLTALTIQISSNDLMDLGTGEVEIRISRILTNTSNIMSPAAGGEIYTEYTVMDTIHVY